MKLHADSRTVLGKKVKTLRAEGLIPATIYGPKRASTNIQIDRKEFVKAFKAAGFSNFIDLEVGSEKAVKVLVKDFDKHPVNDQILDASFYQIDEDSKISVDVPIHFLGEAPAVKNNVGFLVTAMDDIALYCLPKDLPSSIEVDISNLNEIGDSISVTDLKLPEGVEYDSEVDTTASLVYIAAPQKEIVEEVVAEPELDADGNPIVKPEGEAAEGEAAATPGEEKKEGAQ